MVGSLTFQIPRPGFHRSDARERGAVDAYSGCGDPGRPRAFRSTDADRRVALRLVRRYEWHQKMARAIAASVDRVDSGKDIGRAVGRIIV